MLISLVLIVPGTGWTSEEEIENKQRYPSGEEETAEIRERFTVDLGIGYGYSYSDSVSFAYLTQLMPEAEIYLERLGLTLSQNGVTLRLSTFFAVTPAFGFYVMVPYGMVETKAETNLPGLINIKFGVGDIRVGSYLSLLSETERRPKVTLGLDYDTDTAIYSSLGDGTRSFTITADVRKFISPSVYLVGTVDHTFRMEKNEVEPGDIRGYGGGIGFLTGSGQSKFVALLKKVTVDEAKLNGFVLLDGSSDLSLTLTWLDIVRGIHSSFYATRLNEGLDFKKNSFGFNFNFPLFGI